MTLTDSQIVRVLRATQYMFYPLLWGVIDGELWIAVNCSDVFVWGSADSENISTEEDVLLLEELAKEFRRSRDYDLVPDLYAAIKRNMAPANLLVHSGVEDGEMLKRMSSLPNAPIAQSVRAPDF